ncbi:MAG: glycosyltransferase family A protein [Rhodothermales bacterium]|nr:glycosyltransferase family A protein [Rhodothermales bacterium]
MTKGIDRMKGGKSPLISCIVPTLNSARYLGEALSSIRGQTHGEIELIVVDAGSSDTTIDIVRREFPGARVLIVLGCSPSAARNAGIRSANGTFLAFLDSDDLWYPQKLELQLSHFRQNPGLDASITLVETFWAEGLEHEQRVVGETFRGGTIPGYATTTLMAPRATFERFGVLEEDRWYTDAAEWFERVRRLGGVVEVLPEILLKRRIHENAITRRGAEKSREEWLTFLKSELSQREVERSHDSRP